VEIPKGFESVSFFSRLCRSGMCSWSDIKTGRITITQCFELALMIDWEEMAEKKAAKILGVK